MLLNTSAMFVPLLLTMIAAPLGAIDIIYFHILKFKLYDREDSRLETFIHLIRGILFVTGAFILLNYKPTGLWFWGTGIIFILDFINSIADVSIENQSRRTLGGLPSLEYVIHTIGSTFAGGIAVSFFIFGWENRLMPTSLEILPEGTYPLMFVMNGKGLVVGGILLLIAETTLIARSLCRKTCLA